MKQFVLCYAESIENPDVDWFVFVDKLNPPWQLNRLNLPGGKVGPGEEIFLAACRELKTATGLVAERDQCELLGTLHGIDWIVSVVLCPFKGPFSVQYGGKERPVVISLREALSIGSRILPELRTIVPLCICRRPWQMIVSEDRNWFNYVLQVNDE